MFKFYILRYLFFGCALILTMQAFAGGDPPADRVIHIDAAHQAVSAGPYIAIFQDKGHSDINSIPAADFRYQPKEIPLLSYAKGDVWTKITIVNGFAGNNLYLNFEYQNLSKVLLYEQQGNHLALLDSIGNGIDNRDFNEFKKDFIFRVHLAKGDTGIYYMKINSVHPVFLPLFVRTESSISSVNNNRNLFFGVYFGIIAALFLYNIFLLISTRDRSYLFYVIYLLFLAVAQATVSGYAFKYLWPDFPHFNNYALIASSCMASITGVFFAVFFLRISFYYSRVFYLIGFVILLFVAAFFATFTGNNHVGYLLINVGNLTGGPLLLVISIMVALKGYKPAYNYLIAWSFLLAGVIIFALRNFGFIAYTNFSTYSIYVGSALEAILLSTALADRINTLRKDKEESQLYALKVSRENENLIREQNIILEQKVSERTNELQNANEQLNQALGNLKDAQTQLVESEKMASLGQLTAGIAHEINNPINFVKANIKPLKLDIEEIFSLVSGYGQLHEQNNGELSTLLDKIEKQKEELDLDFLKQEIGDLIQGIEDGAERTAKIVRGLRIFSRLDEDELKVANVHDGLESTLILLRNSIPSNILIEKSYNAEGNIECFPGKLNQVFMNILNNAIQAIQEKHDEEEVQHVYISTKDLPGKKISISIRDTGNGMTEATIHRIFEPFFTTKSVGVGTGLGMAIVFKIIEEHKGKIEVKSSPGAGAEFVITLPYIHPAGINY